MQSLVYASPALCCFLNCFIMQTQQRDSSIWTDFDNSFLRKVKTFISYMDVIIWIFISYMDLSKNPDIPKRTHACWIALIGSTCFPHWNVLLHLFTSTCSQNDVDKWTDSIGTSIFGHRIVSTNKICHLICLHKSEPCNEKFWKYVEWCKFLKILSSLPTSNNVPGHLTEWSKRSREGDETLGDGQWTQMKDNTHHNGAEQDQKPRSAVRKCYLTKIKRAPRHQFKWVSNCLWPLPLEKNIHVDA